MAHAYVTGGATSDSERDISVGGVSAVHPKVFAGADYVALGHLHGRQRVRDGVRYSGSPVALSFSEATHTKGSWLVDLGSAGVTVEAVDAPVERPLAVLRGDIDLLLTDPALTPAECVLVPGDADRPRPPAGGDGAAQATLPPHTGAAVRPSGRARAGA